MRYPNLRYGNPNEFAYYVQGLPVKDVAKRLRRSERSIRNWLTGKEKMPWWIPELLRLQRMERNEQLRQMNMSPVRHRLGFVDADVIEFPVVKPITPTNEDQKNEYEIPCLDISCHAADGLRRNYG